MVLKKIVYKSDPSNTGPAAECDLRLIIVFTTVAPLLAWIIFNTSMDK